MADTVIDDIVYDCTLLKSEHPGGEQTIQSFAGAECSWQFWKFHGEKEMEGFESGEDEEDRKQV
jgi:cytochrome b involved in lipid metabolism